MLDVLGRPARRSIRFPSCDYTRPGQHFVTICTFNMRCLFGAIVNGSVRLNVIGRIAMDCWRTIPEHFPNLDLEAFVVMPNHVHGILTIKPDHVADGHGCPVPLQPVERFQRPVAGSIPTVIRSYKQAVTYLTRKTLPESQPNIWQSNYFERILRGEKEFSLARRYIFDNPWKWSANL